MIDQILEKLGLKDVSELNEVERATWSEWASILSKQDVTIEDLKAFLPKELERANIELRKFENAKEKDQFYKAYSSLLDTITKFIAGPTKQREALIAFLKQKYKL